MASGGSWHHWSAAGHSVEVVAADEPRWTPLPAEHHHHREDHRSDRVGWLRAAVLGANDGIVSTASLIVGMIGSGASETAVRTAGIAGLVAGALSMAVGEYVSVSSQGDVTRADLAMEARALEEQPRAELAELTQIWQSRGLSPALAREVASELTRVDALGAHARDELGLTEVAQARPLQAAWASALAFALGALIPLVVLVLAPDDGRPAVVMAAGVVALAGLGGLAAALGGAPRLRATGRVAVGGAAAMGVTLLVGQAAGAALG